MSRGRTAWAVVSLASLDVRREPAHRSELKSQLLMGEVVRRFAVSRDGLWWRVENAADAYRGWVRTWGLVPASAARASRWKRRATARVGLSWVEARSSPRGGALVSPLFLNSRLIPAGSRTGRKCLELPDGRRAWVPAGAVAGSSAARSLMDRIRDLLGVPYLWGGRTPLGFDCSGFTQQVLSERGIALPRDAWQQFRATKPLAAGSTARLGDLIFFAARGARPSHVGIALGGGYYAHARGRVMIGSVDPSNPLCDRQLLKQMRGVRRPFSGRLRRPSRGPGLRRAT